MPIVPPEPLPAIPPPDLIARVTQQFSTADADAARVAYHEGAVKHVQQFERAATAVGRDLASSKRLLDFGCGPGRLMRLLGGLAETGTELHGVDVDADLVGWAKDNLPYAEFVVGPHRPPLPYPDGHFDCVLNHSVFTHLDRDYQDAWLGELQRVTSPGALLLLTVHSARQWNTALRDMRGGGEDPSRYVAELEQTGLTFIAEDTFIGTTHPDWYHTTFHAPWYIFEHWSQWFRVRAVLPEGSDTQDLVVLERLAEPDPDLHPIGHASAPQAGAGNPVAATRPVGETTATLARLLADDGARRSTSGAARYRALRGELVHQDAVHAATLEALTALTAELQDVRQELSERRRLTGVLKSAVDELATRNALAISELRAQLDERGER